MPLPPATLLHSRYRIDALLGQGGMGAVYDAWDDNLGVRVAVKENLNFTEAAQRQFEREARLLAQLHHQHLPDVKDHFLIPGQGQYLVMQFVEGEDLVQRLKRLGPMPEADVLRWADQILSALAYLHRRNIIHRDLKPANIKITPDGEAMLVDFGIAKEYDVEGGMTTTGARGLTPGFAPPEQYGLARTDARSDLYSFGATLYALLTCDPPTDAWSRMAKPEKFVPLARRPTNVSQSLAAAIDRALEMEPEARWQSAGEMKVGLRAEVKTIVEIPRSPPALQNLGGLQDPRGLTGRGGQGMRLAVAGGVLAVLAVFALAAFVIVPLLGGALRPTEAATPTLTPTQTLTPTIIPSPTQTPTPTLPPLPSTLTDTRGVPMVLVAAGPFEMGSNADDTLAECKKIFSDCRRDWFTDEEPTHTVTLDDYYMDQYEVTNARYAECVAAGACEPPHESGSYTRSSYYGDAQYDGYPVIHVDWNQATTYCEWRGARLPTEAEWEKAARGTDGRMYPWGNIFDGNKMNFCDRNCSANWANKDYDDGYFDTAPVGSYTDGASPYGIYDLAGNVWEWVADWYDADYYSASPSENPAGPSSGEDRVVRGGAWGENEFEGRSPERDRLVPTKSYNLGGVRCARSP